MAGTLDYATYRRKWKKLHNHTLLQNALHGQIKAFNVPERVGDKPLARSLPPVVGRKFR